MLPEKVPAGKVDEGVVAGENDRPGGDRPLTGPQGVAVYLQDPAVLKDGQSVRQTCQQLQRMEQGLVPQTQSLGRERKLGILGEKDIHSQTAAGIVLCHQSRRGALGVQIACAVLKVTVDVPLPHQPPQPLHGLQVSPGVLSGGLDADVLDQGMVFQPVLGGQLGGSTGSLTAADAVRFQQDDADALSAQQMGGEQPGDASSNDSGVGLDMSLQPWIRGKGNGFGPDGSHGSTSFWSSIPRFRHLTAGGGFDILYPNRK